VKNELTISEFAKLMGVSVHQIRYFEEKGVLQPAYVNDNQYRMYGMDQIYHLSHILLLRKLGVSVSSIQESMAYTPGQYQQLLRHSLEGVEAEIARLTELQQFIRHVLREGQNFDPINKPYQIKERKAVQLAKWLELDGAAALNARHLAEHARNVPDLFESDVHWISDGTNSITLYMESDKRSDLTLPAGTYFTKQVLVENDEDLEQHIEPFYTAISAHSLDVGEPLVLVEKSYLSLFGNKKLCCELQILIKPDPPELTLIKSTPLQKPQS